MQSTLISVVVGCCHSEKYRNKESLKSQLENPGHDTMMLESVEEGTAERGETRGAGHLGLQTHKSKLG